MKVLPTILLAEDDDGHALLIRNGLRKTGLGNPVIRFRDGQEVLDYLGDSAKGSATLPPPQWVLLLDIRMPKVGGIEVLRQVRMNHTLDRMPVIMLTTTDDPIEARHCLQLGCNSYVMKPVNAQLFNAALHNLAGLLSPQEVPQQED